ncbi:hypothetical protein SAMN04487974_1039 [Pelagibacterium luteolum]|uniref:Uncharacterized protein n=1 Tax=Pelagibacterium luteolum TaxID=440168 RepID=A0A1G7UDY0_9HYPH|nr:hypothetical protein SAMN04487974_1039 [Pelagibacterium luteolum]
MPKPQCFETVTLYNQRPILRPRPPGIFHPPPGNLCPSAQPYPAGITPLTSAPSKPPCCAHQPTDATCDPAPAAHAPTSTAPPTHQPQCRPHPQTPPRTRPATHHPPRPPLHPNRRPTPPSSSGSTRGPSAAPPEARPPTHQPQRRPPPQPPPRTRPATQHLPRPPLHPNRPTHHRHPGLDPGPSILRICGSIDRTPPPNGHPKAPRSTAAHWTPTPYEFMQAGDVTPDPPQARPCSLPPPPNSAPAPARR